MDENEIKELLGKEVDLQTKLDSGENLEQDEIKDLVQIGRIKQEKETSKQTEKEMKTLQAQKKHQRTKREEAEAKLKGGTPPTTPPADKKTELEKKDEEWKEKMEFALVHKEYSAEEVGKIISYAKGKNVSLEDASKSEFVKAGLKAIREKVAKEKKIPESSSPGGVSKKYTPKELEDMKEEDFKEYEKKQREEKKTGI